jgi:hypothetical protein
VCQWAYNGLSSQVLVDSDLVVYDASPIIANGGVVQLGPLSAGGSAWVTIYGFNFGAPGAASSLTFTPSAGNTCGQAGALTYTTNPAQLYWASPLKEYQNNLDQINVFVTASSGACGNYDVQITSGGVSGNGFQANPQNAQNTPQGNKGTPPVAVTAVSITQGGVVVTNTTQTVVVGQQIALTGYPAGGIWGVNAAYASWDAAGGTGTTAVSFFANPTSMYWVTAGNQTVTYTFAGESASVTFNVVAPTVSNLSAQPTSPWIGTGRLDIELDAAANVAPPAGYLGTPTWIQVISSGAVITYSAPGVPIFICQPPGTGPWLDGGNPYGFVGPFPFPAGANIGFFDQPQVGFGTGYSSVARVTQFTLYLMWQPTIAGATTFQVPLESLTWGTTDATATLANGVWTAAGTTPAANFTATNAYPTWSSTLAVGA